MSKDWIEFEDIRVGDHLRVEEDCEFRDGPLRSSSETSEGVVTTVDTSGGRRLVIERDGCRRVIHLDRPSTKCMDFCRLSKPREVGYWKVAYPNFATVLAWNGVRWTSAGGGGTAEPGEDAELTYIGRGDM